jgi:hypothetical protein
MLPATCGRHRSHVRVIALDIVDRVGGSNGVVRPAQIAWLRGSSLRP